MAARCSSELTANKTGEDTPRWVQAQPVYSTWQDGLGRPYIDRPWHTNSSSGTTNGKHHSHCNRGSAWDIEMHT
eukprot:6467269-Amphidinium_carterae.1